MRPKLFSALLIGAGWATLVTGLLYVGYLLAWYLLIAACVSGNPDAGSCGNDLMTAGARILLAPFF